MRVGIVGAGGMGNVHARQYRKMADVELAFFDLDAERTAGFGERWQVGAKSDVDALIEWADVVDVCLPTYVHKEVGLKAIAAGRALFVEKPLARTLLEGVALVEAASKADVPLMVGQVVRFFPDFAAGHGIVENGGIGTPAAARTRRGGGAPQGGSWFLDQELSGGILLDLAIHDFDWLRWTFGEVSCLYARSVAAAVGSGTDYALTVLTFDSGLIAHVEATWMDPGGSRTTYEVAGSEGLISFDSRATPSLRTHAGGKTVLESNLAELDDPYFKEIDGFLAAVKSGGPIPVTAYDGLMALSIALSAVESANTGKVVTPARP